jgi:hypothetical protein
MDMGYWMWNGYWVIEPPRRSFPDLWPCPPFWGVRASRVESAHFVVTRRRETCLLAPPQHGGARFPTLTPEGE